MWIFYLYNGVFPQAVSQEHTFFPCFPIDGKWSQWSRWGECSRKCGGGMQFRQRVCSPTTNGGKPCEGEKTERRDCNAQRCNGKLCTSDTKPFYNPREDGKQYTKCVKKRIKADFTSEL